MRREAGQAVRKRPETSPAVGDMSEDVPRRPGGSAKTSRDVPGGEASRGERHSRGHRCRRARTTCRASLLDPRERARSHLPGVGKVDAREIEASTSHPAR